MIQFLKYLKAYYILSGLLVISALALIFVFGLKFGIDFVGGSILEVNFAQRPENQTIQEKLKEFNLGEITIQPTGDKGVIIRVREIDQDTHQKILSKISEISETKEERFENIGPIIGKELRQKTIILIIVSLIALLCYIAIAFKKVSFPVSSLQYGVSSIITLSFDILITVGLLAFLGEFYNVQFNIPIITALLTILGYTINDKVIVFDRIRENLLKHRGADFDSIVNQSLNETIVRSLTTGSCTLLVLFSIFLFGGETLKYFALTLIVGIVIGTYSSLFLAAPLLVNWLKWKKMKLRR